MPTTQAPEPINESRLDYLERLIDLKCDNYHLTIGVMKSHNGPKDYNVFGSIKTKTEKSHSINIPGDTLPHALNNLIKFLERI